MLHRSNDPLKDKVVTDEPTPVPSLNIPASVYSKYLLSPFPNFSYVHPIHRGLRTHNSNHRSNLMIFTLMNFPVLQLSHSIMAIYLRKRVKGTSNDTFVDVHIFTRLLLDIANFHSHTSSLSDFLPPLASDALDPLPDIPPSHNG